MGGLILLLTTAVALTWANSRWSRHYFELWHVRLAGASLHFLVNDVLMAVFFFVVGMEIKREVLVGELARPKQAVLPVMAAAGGAIVPALIYLVLNVRGAARSGWGVPIATDIAFAVGVMALLGKRIPIGVKVFMTALAIADDLMAVLVIAIFYSAGLAWPALAGAGVCLAALAFVNRLGIRRLPTYLLLGILLWYFTLQSGVHSTVAGVALALTIPAQHENDLLYRLEHRLHPWVTFFIMPVFALANAGLLLGGKLSSFVSDPVVWGIAVGLLLGKPIGITLASWLAVKLRVADLPALVHWRQLHAASWLGGIGFTMSLFIGNLAFDHGSHSDSAKLGIFVGSLVAGLFGSMLLLVVTEKPDLASVGEELQKGRPLKDVSF